MLLLLLWYIIILFLSLKCGSAFPLLNYIGKEALRHSSFAFREFEELSSCHASVITLSEEPLSKKKKTAQLLKNLLIRFQGAKIDLIKDKIY